MKFGELKSKIDTYLVESYKKNKLKDSLFVFEQLVLKNKNISVFFKPSDPDSDYGSGSRRPLKQDPDQKH